jgi:D-sedoheptulose 7-phosphate isomerase
MNNIDRIYVKNAAQFADNYFNYLSLVLKNINRDEVASFISIILGARESNSNIFFIGNGGSAATASHFANDIAIGTNSFLKPFRAISLCDNLAILTAIGNDFGYDQIFSRQLMALGHKNDVLVGISASGNSINLINAFDYAKSVGIKTVALTAFDGGKLKNIADYSVHVPTEKKEYGPAEDAHMVLDHLVGAYLGRFIREA